MSGYEWMALTLAVSSGTLAGIAAGLVADALHWSVWLSVGAVVVSATGFAWLVVVALVWP